MAGRRRVSSFNPLRDNVQSEKNDSWICVSDNAVSYYARPERSSYIEKECEPGTKIRAVKEGNWLKELDPERPDHLETGLYLPVRDPVNQSRLFKNERVMLWETDKGRQRSASNAGSENTMSRNNSNESIDPAHGHGMKVWHCVAEHGVPYRSAPSYDSPPARRCEKGSEVIGMAEDGWLKIYEYGQDTGFFLPMTDPNSNAMLFHTAETMQAKSSNLGPRRSFRWVDSEGMSHRMSHATSEDHDEIQKKSDVWICVSRSDVPYHLNADCTHMSGRFCRHWDKVNGIKEGNHIQVMEVTATMDMAEMLGRRSLKASTKFHIKETGEYLPFTDSTTGERLFKNEKLVLWEQASKQTTEPQKDANEPGCSVM